MPKTNAPSVPSEKRPAPRFELPTAQAAAQGAVWVGIGAINDNFGIAGWVVAGIFYGAWTISVLI